MLTKSIEQYKNQISKKKNTISELLEKEKTAELNYEEKNLLLSTQRELINLDKMIILDVPESLTSVETLDKIVKARKDAENYINSLLYLEDDESKG